MMAWRSYLVTTASGSSETAATALPPSARHHPASTLRPEQRTHIDLPAARSPEKITTGTRRAASCREATHARSAPGFVRGLSHHRRSALTSGVRTGATPGT